jgi:dTDP-4-amino-4,6-dideoxygalactose transaminase
LVRLPMFYELTDEQLTKIIMNITNFYN